MSEHVRVAIIGSGFAGLGTSIALKRAGRHDFVVLEKGTDVGGTWRDNSYPGCACDVPSRVYSFSFAQHPDWSHTYARQPEIFAYLQRTARDYGVLPHIRFGTELLSATRADGVWTLQTSTGTLTADVVVAGTGPLSAPSLPDIPGISSFAGTAFHSAEWDHSWSPEGSRVAVIGTGASAIQFVPQIQPSVAQLLLFQRTAPWVMPRHDREITAREKRAFRRFPLLLKAMRGWVYATSEVRVLGFRYKPSLLKAGEKMALKHLSDQVPDPELRAKLTPHFALGCKRVLMSNTYFPALAAPNADVITEKVVEIVPEGVVTADGVTHEVDTLIFGTGFSVTHPPMAERVSVDGVTLTEHWKDGGMQALHGMAVAGYPNFFVLVGPNTGLGHNSIVLMIEAQVDHLMKALDHLDALGATTLEPRADVQAAYNIRLQRELAHTVWNTGGCESWYLDEHGRNSTLWPTFTFSFMREVRAFDPTQYVVT